MARTEPTAFQRVFSRRDLFRNGPLWACAGFALSSLLLCAFLIDLFLITDLLVHGGRLVIPAGHHEALVDLVGESSLARDDAPPQKVLAEVIYSDRGILPTVWRERNRFWRPALKAAYVKVPFLRDNFHALMALVTAAALIGWLRSMLESRSRVVMLRKSLDIATRLRQSIHRQTLRLGPSDLEGRGSENAYQLFTDEVDRLRDGAYRWAVRTARDPLQAALLLGLGFVIDPRLAVVCLVPAGACWFLADVQRRRVNRRQKLAEAAAEKELKLLAESLERTRLVRGFGMESFERDLFSKSLERLEKGTAETLRSAAWARRGVRIVLAVCLALVLFLVGGAVLLPPRDISFATGMLLLTSFVAAGFPLQRLVRLWGEHDQTELAAHRIQTYLNLIPEVGQAVGAKFLQPLSRMLTFEDVEYTTPNKRRLLEGLSLKVPFGKQVAIVATEPLEALAMAYLLPRFIEPQRGRILIDGEDIAWVTLESLRAEAIFVGGTDPFLTATIRENISGGNPEYSLQEVTEAAKIAHAHNFIVKLPQGYETVIGEHGEQLDAGQGFRLGLARAVLRKPALLIIEEPSEALDEDTKSLLDDAYKRITAGRTVLFLAKRLSTVKRADEIVLLHRGRLAAIGPHSRLVQSSPLYRHWEYINFNEFRNEFEGKVGEG